MVAALGMGAATLGTITGRETVTKVPTPTPVYGRYASDAERLRHMARGRWITDGEWKVVSLYGMEFRPEINRRFYNHSGWYRGRVDANPAKCVPPSGPFRELSSTAKGLKAGAGACDGSPTLRT